MLPSQITFAAEVSEYFVEQLCLVFFRYNRCPHHCLNWHEQFAIEIFFWWSRVTTIRRTPLWQRYDKESLSIHCQKVWSKTKHFAWYFPSVWLEGHSFFLSYLLLMPVWTIPALILKFAIINNCFSLFFFVILQHYYCIIVPKGCEHQRYRWDVVIFRVGFSALFWDTMIVDAMVAGAVRFLPFFYFSC